MSEAASSELSLAAYGALVREYHPTLDLVSAVALQNWQLLLADAAAYASIISELIPQAGTIVDMGSGAGLPGIPLAIHFPERNLWLTERRRRRAAFLNIARGQLGLANAQVHAGDIQELSGFRTPVVTAQAVSEFVSVYELSRHLHADEVLLVSSKGDDWQRESAELAARVGPLIASSVRPRASGDGFVVGLLLQGGLRCR